MSKKEKLLASIKNKDGNTFLNLFDKVFEESNNKDALSKEIADAFTTYDLPEAVKLNLSKHLKTSWKSQGLSVENIDRVLNHLLKLLKLS